MSTRPSTPQRPDNAKTRAAARAAAQRRKRFALFGGLGVVIAVALIVAIASSNGSSNSSASTTAAAPSPDAAAVVQKVTAIPASVSDGIGSGTAKGLPAAASGTALSVGGKPEVLYIGAEYCPFCAAQRWPMLIALSRFGTFANVGLTHSSSSDVYPSTQTFSFHGSTYTSEYLAFTAVETATNQLVGNRYEPLDTMTAAQQSVFSQLNPQGGIPFFDLAGKYLVQGAMYDPGVLQGKTASEIADAVGQPSTAISQAVLGSANGITAALCKVTNGQPATVCGSAAIAALSGKLG